jgi:hypothetical protein
MQAGIHADRQTDDAATDCAILSASALCSTLSECRTAMLGDQHRSVVTATSAALVNAAFPNRAHPARHRNGAADTDDTVGYRSRSLRAARSRPLLLRSGSATEAIRSPRTRAIVRCGSNDNPRAGRRNEVARSRRERCVVI